MSIGHIHLTPQFVQAVRDAVDILPLAEDHTRLKKQGHRYKGLCPLHKEKTPSFSVDPDQNLFYCFGCGAGGDAIRLHMMMSGDDFPAAIESLARRFGVPLPKATASQRRAQKERRDLERVLEAANDWFRAQLVEHVEPRRYLDSRGISPELADEYELGFAPPGWEGLLEALKGSHPVEDLEAAGLVSPSRKRAGEHYDRFRHRLMFPIRTVTGRLVGFGGRTLGDDRAKYVNSPETERFQKGRILYGLDRVKRALREEGRAVLVEGYFDVLGTAAADLTGPVASMGTSLTAQQAKLLARYAELVVVGYDGDRAGEEAYRRALPLLLRAGLEVRRLELPVDGDPDTVRTEEGPESLRHRVETAPDAVERELLRLVPDDAGRRPQQQGRIADDAAELLRAIPDPIVRYTYGRRAAERIGIPFDLLEPRLRREQRGSRSRPPAGERREDLPSPREKGAPRRGLEEGTIRELLRGLRLAAESGTTPRDFPSSEDLPDTEVFAQEECRNFFAAFRDLYGGDEEDGSRLPSVEEVKERLETEGGSVEFLARLLLGPGSAVGESDGSSRPPGQRLREYLRRLERDWLKRENRRLAREIREAHRAGDDERMQRLTEEKHSLSHRVHARAEP